MKNFTRSAKRTLIISGIAALGIAGVAILFPGRAQAEPAFTNIQPASSPASQTSALPLVGNLPTTPGAPAYATRNYLARSLASSIALPGAPALTHGAWMGGGMGEFDGHVGLGFVAATALPHHLTGSLALAGSPSDFGTPAAIRLEIGGGFGNWG